jgi:hypothetical protein
MATTTPNYGWPVPTSTDLVKNGATAIEALGDAIDASIAELKGGTTGQVLSKTSNTDMDFTWVAQDDSNAIQNSIVNAKGDLIGASANDTPAILSVGNNGETLVADSSTSVGLRYNPQNVLVNPVINGGFDIWQRGTSKLNGQNSYVADRWIGSQATVTTFSRQNVSDSTNLPNIQYCLRAQRTSGSAQTDQMNISQSMETVNSIPYAGKPITFSFYARAGANYSATSSLLNAQMITGTGTDQNVYTVGYTGSATLINQNATLTTTWQRFAYTGTVASNVTEIGLTFVGQTTGTAGANDWYEITGIQIDVGTYTASSAPTFRRTGGSIQGELAACQRYYERTGGTDVYASMGTGIGQTATAIRIVTPYKVTKRVTPTAIDYSTLQVNDGSTIIAVSSLSLAATNVNNNFGSLDVVIASGGTQYRPYFLGANNSASAYLGFSAEL